MAQNAFAMMPSSSKHWHVIMISRAAGLAQAMDTNMLYNELGTVPEEIDGIDHEVLQHIRSCFGYKGSRKARTRCPGIFNSEASPLSSSGMG